MVLTVLIVCLWFREIEWEFDVLALPFSFTNKFMPTERSREKFAHVVSVDRNIQNTVIVSKHVCSAISNMDVPIKNTNLFLVKFLLSDSCGNSYVIEKTKSADIRAMSVMPRRPNNCKYGVDGLTRVRLTKSPNSFDSAAC